MSFIGNVIWFVFGGFFLFLEYMFAGLLLCCTVVGIPFGLQVFKLASLALNPFGKQVVSSDGGLASGCISIFMNILWLPAGIILALEHLIIGLVFCVTVIGIPFGLQHFKLALLAFLPFGRTIV